MGNACGCESGEGDAHFEAIMAAREQESQALRGELAQLHARLEAQAEAAAAPPTETRADPGRTIRQV